MITPSTFAKMTRFSTPVGGLLLGALAPEPALDALNDYEADHASQAGYTRGPDGEWITAAPAERWARR
jgi:hypothetical protein